MAAVQQDPKIGQEPNANSTPRRRRNTNMILVVLGLLIALAVAALVLGGRQPGAGMGGSLSARDAPASTGPTSAP
ncbi:hypothetical protein [uncultured Caulobacter sp.]|uniref:hypothetical protein n=1 Tax=uncultured Caulobacter sp. TaxID=158749 RepID=UPI00263A08B0|nr:hypothetical protein [uncultured Caulobacter sp.]